MFQLMCEKKQRGELIPHPGLKQKARCCFVIRCLQEGNGDAVMTEALRHTELQPSSFSR